MEHDLFSYAEAKAARDKGIAKVTERSESWQEKAVALLHAYPEDQAISEELRVWLSDRIGEPHHHNATGAMIKRAIRHGVIERTGQWRKCRTKKSHARESPVYRIVR